MSILFIFIRKRIKILFNGLFKTTIKSNLKYRCQIKLLDRSFNAKTEHALEILDFVFKNCHPGVQLQFEINGDVLDQRIIDFINEEAPDGLLRFEIGIQSTYEPTNKVVQRYQNFERLCDVIRQLQQNHKIDFHLDLIAGLPLENLQRFSNHLMMFLDYIVRN